MKHNSPIIKICDIALSAVVAMFSFGCKIQKTSVDKASSNNNINEKEKKIVKPDDKEPIKVLYGVPMTVYHIRGVITDESAKPLENIRVTVKDTNNGRKLDETITDAEGQFGIAISDRFAVPKRIKLVYDDLKGAYKSDSTENASFETSRDGFSTNAELEIKKQLKKK